MLLPLVLLLLVRIQIIITRHLRNSETTVIIDNMLLMLIIIMFCHYIFRICHATVTYFNIVCVNNFGNVILFHCCQVD